MIKIHFPSILKPHIWQQIISHMQSEASLLPTPQIYKRLIFSNVEYDTTCVALAEVKNDSYNKVINWYAST